MTGIFLRATVVTRGWNGYRNKSQHRKSTLEKKILPPFQQGFEPATFQSRVRRSKPLSYPRPPLNTWLASSFFIAHFWISIKVECLQCCLVVTCLVPHETAAVSAHSVYTIQPCTMLHHFMQRHTHRVHVCLVVACHLHFYVLLW